MTNPAYPAARAAAHRIRPTLEQHFATMHRPETASLASLPDTDTIEALIHAGFWASLRREEDRTPRLSMAFVSADEVKYAMHLERPLSLASQDLTRVA